MPMAKVIPKWWRDADIYIKDFYGDFVSNQSNDGGKALNFKACPAMLDTFTTGYTSEQNSAIPLSLPDWIKNNAKWWSNNEIDDDTFVNGIQYLVNKCYHLNKYCNVRIVSAHCLH